MTDVTMKTASLQEIRRKLDAGELHLNPDAPEGEPLNADFWANARVVDPTRAKSVHLKLDPEVFDYFVKITNGKGHLTRMQAVLKAYMNAHKNSTPPPAK